VRTDTTLASLRPIMLGDDPGATVTAGNSSGQNDGAAVRLVTTLDKADEWLDRLSTKGNRARSGRTHRCCSTS
jgi:acetyl-CoA acetyltransferase